MKIRELRISRGLGLRSLARRSKMSVGHLASVEAERFAPGLATLERISAGLNLEMRRLLLISSVEILFEDDFIREVRTHLPRLDASQRSTLLKTLAASTEGKEAFVSEVTPRLFRIGGANGTENLGRPKPRGTFAAGSRAADSNGEDAEFGGVLQGDVGDSAEIRQQDSTGTQGGSVQRRELKPQCWAS